MGKALVITEKPSVARDICAALGGFSEGEGYFENDATIVTFAVGHIFELLEPEELDPSYKRWTLANLPIIPEEFKLKPKSGQSERIRTIKKLIERTDVADLINACDAGREGELIFREIVKHFSVTKPIRRLWLQSMTTEAIRNGFRSLRPGEELAGLAAAAECRAYSDWLIGMNATRALTKRLKSRKERTAWSAGRVQTPTLAILVGREFEILAHESKPFWRVAAVFEHARERYNASWFAPDFHGEADSEQKDDRLFDAARAEAIVVAVRGQSGTVAETRKPSRESAPPLFDLTSLQREANRRFGWSARRALSAAQRCYDGHKLLTYPRTDSRCLPSDYRATVHSVIDRFAEGSPYADAARRLKEHGLENQGRIFDDSGVSDHFAIIPTGVLPGDRLSGDDQKLFDLVARRFLSAFYPPAVWERVERVTEVAGEHFRTRARSLQEPGWRFVLPPSEGEEGGTLAPLVAGQSEVSGVAVMTAEVQSVAEETKPPARVTEARLLSLMENAGKQIDDEDRAAVLHEKGIGTPATRAEIIENLISKGYVVRVGKALRPTVKGIRFIDTLRRIRVDRLYSPELTGDLEYHLLQVERGQRGADDFMAEIERYTSEIVERAKNFEYEDLYDHEPPLGNCPFGGRQVVERAWFYTCQKDADLPQEAKADPNCPNPGCPLLIWKDTSGRYIDRRSVERLLREGNSGVLDGFTARNGRVYKGVLELDRQEFKVVVRSAGSSDEAVSEEPEYEVNPEPLGRCPVCSEHDVVETPTQFVCESRLREEEEAPEVGQRGKPACSFVFPRTVCKREISRGEAIVYIQNGRTELLTDFTSRFGRPFSAILVLRDTGRHRFEFPPRERGEKTTPRDKAESSEKAQRGGAPGKKRKASDGKKKKVVAVAVPEASVPPARKVILRKKAAKDKVSPQ